mmetsp:Transcript_12118/g.50323  ORF Transcript_12118/g.50323 Transcript_12118/m.50323 type:complete len:276 (+) Transcript_12118:1335-2162(+)
MFEGISARVLCRSAPSMTKAAATVPPERAMITKFPPATVSRKTRFLCSRSQRSCIGIVLLVRRGETLLGPSWVSSQPTFDHMALSASFSSTLDIQDGSLSTNNPLESAIDSDILAWVGTLPCANATDPTLDSSRSHLSHGLVMSPALLGSMSTFSERSEAGRFLCRSFICARRATTNPYLEGSTSTVFLDTCETLILDGSRSAIAQIPATFLSGRERCFGAETGRSTRTEPSICVSSNATWTRSASTFRDSSKSVSCHIPDPCLALNVLGISLQY